MIYYKKILSLFFIFFFLLTTSYSAPGGLTSCCYDVGERKGEVVVGSATLQDASTGEIYQGCDPYTQFEIGVVEGFSCEMFKPLYCLDQVENRCYGFVLDGDGITSDGYYSKSGIFYSDGIDINQDVLNLFSFLTSSDVGNSFEACNPTSGRTLGWYTDPSCSLQEFDEDSGSGGGSGSTPPGNIGTIPEENYIFYDPVQEEDEDSLEILFGIEYGVSSDFPDLQALDNGNTNPRYDDFCSFDSSLDAYFNTGDSCNSKSPDGNYSCFYNPHRGSNLISNLITNSIFSNSEIASCVAKEAITSCSDYKTESNCNSNVAYITTPELDGSDNVYGSRSLALSQGCEWVPSNSFEGGEGICVSNYVDSSNKGYSTFEYSQRLNLDSPEDIPSALVVSNIETYFNNIVNGVEEETIINLRSGGQFEVVIDELSLGNYLFSLGIKPHNILNAKDFDSQGGLEVTIYKYDKNGNQINFLNSGGETPNKELRTKGDQRGGNYFGNVYDSGISIFKTVFFDDTPLYLEGNVDNVKIVISNPTTIPVYLDSLNFEFIEDIESSFKPVDIISSSATSCHECFVEDSYNTCTLEKSNSLGACSYMVPNSSVYYGELFIEAALGNSIENIYLTNLQGDTKERWRSQSLADSLVFCELYDNRTCEDPTNFVNSKFGSNTCEWNAQYGCFKDSLNPEDGIPDFIEMNTFLDTTLTSEAFIWTQSCDVVRPSVYVKLFGKNSEGEYVEYDPTSSTLLGDLYMHYQYVDYFPSDEACEPFNVDKAMYLRYLVTYYDELENEQILERTFKLNQLFGSEFNGVVSIENLFVDLPQSSNQFIPLSTSLLEVNEDVNRIKKGFKSIDYEFLDQSGNVGYSTFDTTQGSIGSGNIDSNSPTIEIQSRTYANEKLRVLDDLFSPADDILNFNVIDDIEVKSCSFKLSSASPNTFYDDRLLSINFSDPKQSSVISNGYNFNINLSEVITQTSPFGSLFNLNVICSDGLNDPQVEIYVFEVDFNIDTSNFYPRTLNLNFSNYTQNDIRFSAIGDITLDGYLDSFSEEFFFYSNEDSLSCTYESEFGSLKGLFTQFPHNSLEEGLGLGYDYKYSSIITFSSEGYKEVILSCRDGVSNAFDLTQSYLVDISDPTLSLINVTSNQNVDVAQINSNLYLTQDNLGQLYSTELGSFIFNEDFINNLEFILSFDGTNSWLSQNYSLVYYNTPTTTLNKSYFASVSYNAFNGSGIQDFNSSIRFYVDSLIDSELLSLFNQSSFEKIEDSLYKVSFETYFYDKAYNELNQNIEFYIDNSTPDFNFSGDIASVDRISNRLFTSNNNPTIDFSFLTPTYREYNCSYQVTWGSSTSLDLALNNGEFSNSFSFNLSALTNGADFTTKLTSVNLICQDIFGNDLTKEYTLIFDDKAPVIDQIIFPKHISRFLLNDNSQLPSIERDLEIVLFEEEEYGITCETTIESLNTMHSCNVTTLPMSENNFGAVLTNLKLLDSDNRRDLSDSSYVCNSKPQLWNTLPYGVEQEFELSVSCSDAAGNSVTNLTSFNVTYYNTSIGNVYFTYDKEITTPYVEFLDFFSSGLLVEVLIPETQEVISSTTFVNGISSLDVNALTSINLGNYLDLEELPIIEKLIIRVGGEEREVSLRKDVTKPEVNISISGEDSNAVIYTQVVPVNLKVDEFGSGHNYSIVYLIDESNLYPIYDSRNQNLSITPYTNGSQEVSVLNTNGEYVFAGIVLMNLTYNSDFRLFVESFDNYGFNGLDHFNLTLKAFDVSLEENSQVKKNPLPTQVIQYHTNSRNPNLIFNLSTNQRLSYLEDVTYCDDYYVYYANSDGGYDPNAKYGPYPVSTDFSFSLASELEFANFDAKENLIIETTCYYNGFFVPILYHLHYDVTPLDISDIRLTSYPDNLIYLPSTGVQIPEIEDTVDVLFNFTNEKYYICDLEFIEIFSNPQYHDCSAARTLSYESSQSFTTDLLMILNSSTNTGDICTRLQNPTSDVLTQIEYSVSCSDLLKNGGTKSLTETLNISYTTSKLLDIDYDVNTQGFAKLYFLAYDLTSGNSIEIWNDSGLVYTITSYSPNARNELTLYNDTSYGFDLSDKEEGVYSYQARLVSDLGFNGDDFIDFDIVFDLTSPEVNLSLTTPLYQDKLIKRNITLQLEASDLSSNIEYAELRTFSGEHLVNFTPASQTLSETYNYLIDLLPGELLELELFVKDSHGNTNLSQLSVEIGSALLVIDDSASYINCDRSICYISQDITELTLTTDPQASSSMNYSCDPITANGLRISNSFSLDENNKEHILDTRNVLAQNEGEIVPFRITCVDEEFQVPIQRDFILVYDTLAPVIEDVEFINTQLYSVNGKIDNTAFDFIDGIKIIMQDTNEIDLSCSVALESSSYYTCNSSFEILNVQRQGTTHNLTTNTNAILISDIEKLGSICHKSSSLSGQLPTSSDLVTDVRISVLCEDGFGRSDLNTFTKDIIMYTSDDIYRVEFNQSENNPNSYEILVYGSYFADVSQLSFSLLDSLDNSVLNFNVEEGIDAGGEFLYKATTLANPAILGNLDDGTYFFNLTGTLNSGDLGIKLLTQSLHFDRLAPQVNISYGQETLIVDGKIQSPVFDLNLEAYDNTSIVLVEYLVDGKVISNYTPNNQNFNRKITFRGDIGENYELKIKATDSFGNLGIYSKDVVITGQYFVMNFVSDNINVLDSGIGYTSLTNPNLELVFENVAILSLANYSCSELSVEYADQTRYSLLSEVPTEVSNSLISPVILPLPLADDNSYAKLRAVCNYNGDISTQLIEEFELYYDNTAPEINGLLLDGKDTFNFPGNQLSSLIIDIRGGLKIDLNDTNEREKVSCSVKFIQNSDYGCSDISLANPEEYIKSGEDLIYFSPLNFFSTDLASNPLCVITNDPRPIPGNVNSVDKTLEATIECQDAALLTSSKTVELPVSFVKDGLINVEYKVNYETKELELEILAYQLDNSDSFIIQLDDLTYYNATIPSGTQSNGVYTYRLNLDISTILEFSGIQLLSIEVRDKPEKGNLIQEVSLDFKAPDVSLSSNIIEASKIYESQVDLSFLVEEVPSEIGRIVLDYSFNNRNYIETYSYNGSEDTLGNEISSITTDYQTEHKVEKTVIVNLPSDSGDYTFRVRAWDNLGNGPTIKTYNFEVSNEFDLLLRRADKVYPHLTQDTVWLVTTKEPELSFEFTKSGVETCVVDRERVEALNGIFTIDLSNYENFLGVGYEALSLKCFNGNNAPIEEVLQVIYVDLLPDFVVDSPDTGFYLSQEPYSGAYEVTSVVPQIYGGLTCDYKLSEKSNISSSWITDYDITLNLSDLALGEYELIMNCVDMLDRGHSSSYLVELADPEIDITTSILYQGEKVTLSQLEAEAIQVKLGDSFGLVIDSNKRGTSCELELESVGILADIGDFFGTIFGFSNEYAVFPEELNPYTLETIDTLSLDSEGVYQVNIFCENFDEGEIIPTRSYYVEVVSTQSVSLTDIVYG